MYSFEHLLLFVKVIDAGNVTQLHRLTKISRITITKKLKELEAAFGKTFLVKVRGCQNLELTKDGHILYDALLNGQYTITGIQEKLATLFDDKSLEQAA